MAMHAPTPFARDLQKKDGKFFQFTKPTKLRQMQHNAQHHHHSEEQQQESRKRKREEEDALDEEKKKKKRKQVKRACLNCRIAHAGMLKKKLLLHLWHSMRR